MFSQPVAATSTSTSLQCSANCCLMKITKYIGVGTGGAAGAVAPATTKLGGGAGISFCPPTFCNRTKVQF